ncbi:MAG: hypothetical protein JWP87_3875 [Labilithrix sp.]|nr:hypothetical protein [Labilithrix sp.]
MKRILLVAALALSACAAPASYDGLAGGTKEDAAVVAPRPVSPVTVSLIASSRPRLRWDLGSAEGANLTGAVVEMSRTRDFAGDVKRFHAKGIELVVPEDLEPGIWFWRLKGDAAGSIGTTPSAVWEMLVRGPAAHGSSDAPTRSMVDMNGDGEADLLVGAIIADPTAPPSEPPLVGTSAAPNQDPKSATYGAILVYPGSRDRGFAGGASDAYLGMDAVYTGPMSLGGGTDFNGDGLTDVIASGLDVHQDQMGLYFDVNVAFAAAPRDSGALFDYLEGGSMYQASSMPALPNVREGADVNGDGFGDAVIGLVDAGMVFLGTTIKGPPAAISLFPGLERDPGPKPVSRLAFGAFDANGDGLADVAFSVADSYQPTARASVSIGSRQARIGDETMIDSSDSVLATAFTAGDFNGDGIDDVAMTTTVDPSTRICIWFGDRAKVLRPGPCVTAPPGEKDFGQSLTAADLEGDGVDELLATTKAGDGDGVRVVRLGANDTVAVAAPIGMPGLGVRLTTIWPGRPGRGRWAAVAADGSRIGIYDGTDLQTMLTPPPGVVKGFGRGLR